MPRVTTRVKSTRGAVRKCGRCGRVIAPGQKYFQWSFRYGGTHFRCGEHTPRRSETTQSILGEVYAAIEVAEDDLPGAECVSDVVALVAGVAEIVDAVIDQYREAAEHFGGAGENAERADELDGWKDELESFDPEEEEDGDEENDDARRFRLESEEACRLLRERGAAHEPEAWRDRSPVERTHILESWDVDLDELQRATDAREAEVAEASEGESEKVEEAREAAQELLNGCPL